VGWRLAHGWPQWAALRMAGFGGCAAGVVALFAWVASGPLQPGWAAAAGTPANLLHGSGTASSSSPVLQAGLDDSLQGTVIRSGSNATATLQDTRDTAMRVVIVAHEDGSGSLTITAGSSTLCSASAAVTENVTATCGSIAVTVTDINVDPSGSVSATLRTR